MNSTQVPVAPARFNSFTLRPSSSPGSSQRSGPIDTKCLTRMDASNKPEKYFRRDVTMKLLALVMLAAVSLTALQPLQAQVTDSTTVAVQEQAPPQPSHSRIYYGGEIGFNLFGDVFRLSIKPLAAYKITDKLSLGAKIGYEYIKDKRFDPDRTYHNYGASLFTRYRVIPQIYGHVEFAEFNYDYPAGREWVPFLLVGGGLAQRVGGNAWVFVEVLFDVLQSSKSPYEEWEPWVTVGVGVGF